MAVQAGLCLAWSETPEDTFFRVMVQLCFILVTVHVEFREVCIFCRNAVRSDRGRFGPCQFGPQSTGISRFYCILKIQMVIVTNNTSFSPDTCIDLYFLLTGYIFCLELPL